MQKFSTLIFDLGNVIIDIDYGVTVAAFQKLVAKDTGLDFSNIVSYAAQHKIFDKFEKGQVSVRDFVDEMKKFLAPETADEAIISAWNSILIDYPPYKFELLKQLKQQYRTLALSNINEVHVSAIDKAAQDKFGVAAFGDFFHAAYYSNQVGMRKPDREIYDFVIKKENLNPAETFFVDDKLENVTAAAEAGLQAYQLTNRNELKQLLTGLHIL